MRNPVKRHYRPTIEEQRQLTLRTNLSFKKIQELITNNFVLNKIALILMRVIGRYIIKYHGMLIKLG